VAVYLGKQSRAGRDGMVQDVQGRILSPARMLRSPLSPFLSQSTWWREDYQPNLMT
jgi:hypothetical protein